MMSLTVPVEDQLLKAIMAKVAESGVTIEKFAIDALRAAAAPDATPAAILDNNVSSEKEFAPHLAATLQRIDGLDEGTLFTLSGNFEGGKRVFSVNEWAAMKSNPGFSPTKFGKFFRKYAEHFNRKHHLTVEIMDKTPDNKQIYKKVGNFSLSTSKSS